MCLESPVLRLNYCIKHGVGTVNMNRVKTSKTKFKALDALMKFSIRISFSIILFNRFKMSQFILDFCLTVAFNIV